jgi:hypothetical protein
VPAFRELRAKEMSAELDTWVERWQTGIDALLHARHFLAEPPPADGDDAGPRLQALLQVRQLLNPDEGHRAPAVEAGERLAGRVHHGNAKVDLAELVRDLLVTIDKNITTAIDQLPPEQHGTIVRTADFARTRAISLPGIVEKGPITWRDQVVWFCLAEIDSLPPDHPLRTAIPEVYLADRTHDRPAARCLILGREEPLLSGNSRPRPYYTMNSVRQFTGMFVARQKQDDEESERQARADERRKQAEFWDSPLGRQVLLEKQLAALKEKGQVPDLPAAPEPAVRVGIGPRPKQPVSTVTETNP